MNVAGQCEEALGGTVRERELRARRWRGCLLGVAASIGLQAAPVRAQAPEATQVLQSEVVEPVEARETGSNLSATELFWQGNDAFSGARFAEAIDRYTRAYTLSHEPALLFNVAQSQRQLGDCQAAREAYARYRELEPNPPEAAIQWAAEPDNACTQSQDGSSVSVGEPVGAGATRGKGPVPQTTPTLPPAEIAGSAAPSERDPLREPNTSARRIVAWSLIGAGAACVGVATWAAFAAHRAQQDAEREAQSLIGSDTPWDAQGEGLQRDADNKGHLALGFGIGAGALIAAGVVVHLVQPDAAASAANHLAGFSASLSPSLAALGYGGAF